MRILFGVILIIFAVVLGAYAYMGGFKSVEVRDGQLEQIEFAYATHRGPYEKLFEAWTGFEEAWEAAEVGPCNALAIYLDPPETPKEDFRTVLGCRIDDLTPDHVADWRAAFPTFTLPGGPALTADFPYKNEASYFFAPVKVYPALQKVMQERSVNSPLAIEVYGVEGESDTISFYFPLADSRSDYQALEAAFAPAATTTEAE